MRGFIAMSVAVAVVLTAASVVVAGEPGVSTAPHETSTELARMKQLEGLWEGTTTMAGGEQAAVVEYQVTSGGSAVVETLFPGTPEEMVSVYHDHGGQLTMTHYCMLGNQPRLELVSASDDRLELSLASDHGLADLQEQHMHALTITWTDPDHITQVWTSSSEIGQPGSATTITLSRLQ